MTRINQPTLFNGLTLEQVERLLSQIACTVDLACRICRQECETHGTTKVAYTFAALDAMLSSVGGMADMASPEPIHGGLSAWLLGPSFGPVRGEGG